MQESLGNQKSSDERVIAAAFTKTFLVPHWYPYRKNKVKKSGFWLPSWRFNLDYEWRKKKWLGDLRKSSWMAALKDKKLNTSANKWRMNVIKQKTFLSQKCSFIFSKYYRKLYWLIVFNDMSTRLRLFYAWRLGNRVHCMFIFTFLCSLDIR